MEQEFVSSHGGTIAVTHLGDKNSALPHVIWGHGWDQSGAALLPMAESLGRFAFSSLWIFRGLGGLRNLPRFGERPSMPMPSPIGCVCCHPANSSGLGIVLVAGSVFRWRLVIRDCWPGWF